MQNNLTIAHDELLQILNLTVLPELGCIHSRSEWFMAMGLLSAPPAIILSCSTQCYVCDGRYKKICLPVVHSGAIQFLDSRQLTDVHLFVLTVANCDEFVDRLAKDKDWLLWVFGKESVTRYNVTAFFLQLLATKILSFELVGNKNVLIVISVDENHNKKFKNILQWEGIQFRVKGKRGRSVSFKDLVEKMSMVRALLDDI